MGNDTLRYKSLDPGCSVEMQPLTAEHRQARLISSARRDRRPSAGLVVDSYEVFPAGAMVVLDIAFADQPFSYRSRGMVSWMVSSDEPTRPHKIGVMIFGMQKLDPDGVPYVETPSYLPATLPVSDETIAPPPDFAPVEADALSRIELEGNMDTIMPPLEPDNPPPPVGDDRFDSGDHQPFPFALDEWWRQDTEAPPTPLDYKEWRSDTIPPDMSTWLGRDPHASNGEKSGARTQASDRDDGALHRTAVGELVSLGSLSLKMANWRRSYLPTSMAEILSPDAPEEKSPQASRDRLPDPDEPRDEPGAKLVFDKNALPKMPDSIPPAAPQFVAFSGEAFDDDIEISVEPDFNAERAMIAAFNQMQGLYKKRDRLAAAQFAMRMSRDLITCEAGVCLLVSARGSGLFSAASDPKTDLAWGAAPRHAEDDLIGAVIKTGQAMRIKSPSADPNLNFKDGGLETENLLLSPVSHEGYVIGVIELRNSPRENGFTIGEENVLTYIGSALGEYIQASLPELESKAPPPVHQA